MLRKNNFRIGIVGAGAMGSLFAYYFIRAGHEVILLDVPERTDALKSGIRIRFMDGSLEHIEVRASSDPAILQQCNIIFIFVKSYATGMACESIAPHIAPDAIFVTLQNGLGNREILEELFPHHAVISGATTIGAYIDSDGIVTEGGKGTITLGSLQQTALEQVHTLLHAANLPVEITPNPDEALWKKVIINAAINPLGALARIPNGKILESAHLRAIQEHLVREAVAVAAQEGILFDAEEMTALVRDVCAKTALNRCSMLQDIEAGRRTEIDAITGAIVKTAHTYGISVPHHEVIFALISALEDQKKTGVAPGIT